MKKSVMKKWVKALRSGEYLQCKGELTEKNKKGQDTFCCLGVLTNLYVEENGISKLKLPNSKGNTLNFWKYNENYASYLSMAVQSWAGMSSSNGRLPIGTLNENANTLAGLNDKGSSFEEIADIIEKNYKEL